MWQNYTDDVPQIADLEIYHKSVFVHWKDGQRWSRHRKRDRSEKAEALKALEGICIW